LLGLLCFLLLERPVMNLEKFLLPQRKRGEHTAIDPSARTDVHEN